MILTDPKYLSSNESAKAALQNIAKVHFLTNAVMNKWILGSLN
jgi:hypothetical protein